MTSILFTDFVTQIFDGNQSKAAEALGMDRSMVSRICNGDRGVSPGVALRIESVSGGRFNKEQFIWPDAPADQGEAA